MTSSVLTSVKKTLNLAEDDTSFDPELVLYINSIFSVLNGLGVGPANGFAIEDKEGTWEDFIGTDLRRNQVKTYMCLRVRLLFDPPTTSYLIDSMDRQVKELEWRINEYRERTEWMDPDPDPDPELV